jgi:hypothetical protein
VLVVVRFVHLCVTYVKQKNELTAEERQEVLSYFMSRLPVLASQVYRLLKCFKSVMAGLSASQNFDLANYIAPEVCFNYFITHRTICDVLVCAGGWLLIYNLGHSN